MTPLHAHTIWTEATGATSQRASTYWTTHHEDHVLDRAGRRVGVCMRWRSGEPSLLLASCLLPPGREMPEVDGYLGYRIT